MPGNNWQKAIKNGAVFGGIGLIYNFGWEAFAVGALAGAYLTLYFESKQKSVDWIHAMFGAGIGALLGRAIGSVPSLYISGSIGALAGLYFSLKQAKDASQETYSNLRELNIKYDQKKKELIKFYGMLVR